MISKKATQLNSILIRREFHILYIQNPTKKTNMVYHSGFIKWRFAQSNFYRPKYNWNYPDGTA